MILNISIGFYNSRSQYWVQILVLYFKFSKIHKLVSHICNGTTTQKYWVFKNLYPELAISETGTSNYPNTCQY